MPQDRLESTERIADVFDYLIAHPQGAGVSELSRQLGYSKSVIHRLLTGLEARDYITADESRCYRLGFKALQLGLTALDQINLRQLALPVMERLWAATQETINLSLRIKSQRVYIESLESPQVIRQGINLGEPIPLHLGANSKAILAFLPEEEQERILAQAEGQVTAAGQPISISGLRADLEATRRRGYAVSNSERFMGTFSVAAPIFDHRGSVIGSISISGPTIRWHDGLEEEHARLLRPEAHGLSKSLGYVPETSIRPRDSWAVMATPNG